VSQLREKPGHNRATAANDAPSLHDITTVRAVSKRAPAPEGVGEFGAPYPTLPASGRRREIHIGESLKAMS
jgi:hypothetical protein